ncbi:MAG TPA: metalloregulator ArsR/SmtB family transcription factor [Candidatus Binataceae bacterium]|jgi:DNA-binding transcriptional ArsR family regulator|nr:metalloregulator ArsR/SmtB family transcription factor [Candidatus Binataceae bacterium]
MRTSAAPKLAQAAPIFAALGDETRLHIVARLCGEGPLSIVRLAEDAMVSRQAITKHLRVLEEAGLARSSRAGRESIWELRTKRLLAVQRYLDQISQQWDAALGRLRAFVEEKEQ